MAWTMLLIGLIGGIILTILCIRQLGKASYHSVLCREVFRKITKYRVVNYVIDNSSKSVTVKIMGDKDDNKNIMDALNQLGFAKDVAQSAVDHVNETFPNESLEEKIKIALRVLDNPAKKVLTTG